MKRILFLTGTRADFGKLKSLMRKIDASNEFELYVFITGMHLLAKYGATYIEVEREGFKNIYKYINQNKHDTMDMVLSKTISGLSDYVKEESPDMIVVHGDRVEALAGAIVGSLNNILVSHIEGGEISGTIDELIRHSVSKLAHLHFVCNEGARNRLIQLGESSKAVHVIGSPDIDIMSSKSLPKISNVKARYEIDFDDYCILLFHPVTTEVDSLYETITAIITSLKECFQNTVVIYPNNDFGSDVIFSAYRKQLADCSLFRSYPSIRFEYFITLLKHSQFIIGNSSAGIREAPFFGVPTIDIGSRQRNRTFSDAILKPSIDEISSAIRQAKGMKIDFSHEFGDEGANERFFLIMQNSETWCTPRQKQFVDIH